MRYFLLIASLFCQYSFAQTVRIKGNCKNFPKVLVEIRLYSQGESSFFRNESNRKILKKDTTDQNGNFDLTCPMIEPTLIHLEYMGYRQNFLLKPNDELNIEFDRSEILKIEGNAKNLQMLIREASIVGEDSLSNNPHPMLGNLNKEAYFGFLNEQRELFWHKYLTTCDTSNHKINRFVEASLHGQLFNRKWIYVANQRDWEQLKNLRLQLLDDDAYKVPAYNEALYTYCQKTHWQTEDETTPLTEILEHQYNFINNEFRYLPKTREQMLLSAFERFYWQKFRYANTRTRILDIDKYRNLVKQFIETYPASSNREMLEKQMQSLKY